MPEMTRLWKIIEEHPKEIDSLSLDLESRLEDWIDKDITVVSENLLIIGRQVTTSFNKIIDLLCIDEDGDLNIVELKRDKTPRDITAQLLDYASWVQDLSNDEINDIAEHYFNGKTLEEEFQKKFYNPLPEILNNDHKMLIVGSVIDEDTERIIKYLSSKYGVNINALRFTFFKNGSDEYITRNFLIQPNDVRLNQAKRTRSKRKPNLSLEDFYNTSKENGTFNLLINGFDSLKTIFDGYSTSRTTLSFSGNMDGSKNAIFCFEPFNSSQESGLSFYFYLYRFLEYFKIEETQLNDLFQLELEQETKWNVNQPIKRGYINDISVFDRLVKLKMEI